MTNADRIRAMTDDELLELLDKDCCECMGRYTCDLDREKCRNNTMQWLRKEWNEQTTEAIGCHKGVALTVKEKLEVIK